MAITNYPFGLSSFGFPLIGSGPYLTTGRVFFVNAATGTDSPGYGQDKDRPFDSIDFAIGQCVADRGDTIFVMPGHTEAVGAAGGITADVAGVSIIGLGTGAKRPTITLGTGAGATIAISAANVVLDNLILDLTGFDAVATGIVVTGDNDTIRRCKIIQAGVTNQATVAVSVDGDNLLIEDTEIDASGGAGAAHAILSAAAQAGLTVRRCNIYGNFSTACVGSASTNHLTKMVIEYSRFRQENGTAKNIFNFTTSSTGVIKNNTCEGTTWATAADVASNSTSTSLRWFENYGFDDGAGAVSGVLVPAVGTIA